MLNIIVLAACALFAALLATPQAVAEQRTIQIGSKRFTESYILSEILAATLRNNVAVRVEHKPGLGNTGIVYAALRTGAIDVYAEYTGTLTHELLKAPELRDLDSINRALSPLGLIALTRLGFNNTYALAMREDDAHKRGISRISDLLKHSNLRLGLSQEFMHRKDGWPALRAAYAITSEPRGLDHGLAYEALAANQVDVIDMYSTDAKQVRYRLRVLEDDRRVFPAYEAIILARADLAKSSPGAWAALRTLSGRIDERTMTALNAKAELEGQSFQAIAEAFLGSKPGGAVAVPSDSERLIQALFGPDLLRLLGQHLMLVFVSLAAAVAAGIPLGIWAQRSAHAGRWIMGTVAIIQTIPSLALLAFLIPVLSMIGTVPALVALFLYSLLPIVRNTLTGLEGISVAMRYSAASIGLRPGASLRIIELPIASPTILAGVKTSAVLNVGTATIAAFIGAGGLGERIASGLALNDNAMLLAGAIPAALLALLVQWLFDVLERYCVSPGLRVAASRKPQKAAA